jgi:hypothetical protein
MRAKRLRCRSHLAHAVFAACVQTLRAYPHAVARRHTSTALRTRPTAAARAAAKVGFALAIVGPMPYLVACFLPLHLLFRCARRASYAHLACRELCLLVLMCTGSIPELAFNYTSKQGIALEADLPYLGRDHACTPYTVTHTSEIT